LAALALVEYQLREAHAYENLDRLRHAIRTLNVNLEAKRAALHGTGANTRGQNYLKTLANDVKIAGSSYRTDREALLKLGLPEDDEALQPLLKEHLKGKDGKAQAAGQVKESDPWFWSVGRPSNMSEEDQADWSIELDRVKWFRYRALLERAKEEKETLEEEFSRAVLSFHKSAEIWRALATSAGGGGKRAYAEKQA
ncbi:hypothetical protein C8F04DRAFT_896642, partial [Mycena alexandri]